MESGIWESSCLVMEIEKNGNWKGFGRRSFIFDQPGDTRWWKSVIFLNFTLTVLR